MALGDTKLPKSMVSKPTFSKELIYLALALVGIKTFFPNFRMSSYQLDNDGHHGKRIKA